MASFPFVRKIIFVSACWGWLLPISAQFPEPVGSPLAEASSTPTPTEEQSAWARTWLMAQDGANSNVRFSPLNGEQIVLVGAPGPFYYGTGYRDIPPGPGRVGLFPREEEGKAVAEVEERFESQSFYTFLILEKGGRTELRVVDDTLPKEPKNRPPDAPPWVAPRTLRIYNFTQNSVMEMASPDLGLRQQLSFGEEVKMENLERKVFTLAVLDRSGEGEASRSVVEVDLVGNISVSVLLIRDLYGRFSPRVVVNGTLN